jgi:hypothetical protein
MIPTAKRLHMVTVRNSVLRPPENKPQKLALTWSGYQQQQSAHVTAFRKYHAQIKALADREAARFAAADARYGLPPGTAAEMLKRQDYRCRACNRHESEFARSLALDHCHTTGRVRNFLCLNCNNALGLTRDDPALLRRLADYLEFHAARK